MVDKTFEEKMNIRAQAWAVKKYSNSYIK